MSSVEEKVALKHEYIKTLIGKNITSAYFMDLFERDYESLTISFSDGSGIHLVGNGSTCGTAGYIDFDVPEIGTMEKAK